MIRVLLVPSAELAKSLPPPDVTVEAEYGSFVWEGRLYTAAHHQPSGKYAGRHVEGGTMPSPCNDTNIPYVWVYTIGVSHVDLDTFGGCLRAMGSEVFKDSESFWDAAEAVDVNGAHKMPVLGISMEDQLRLHAYWAWARQYIPRSLSRTEATDITTYVRAAEAALLGILDGNAELLQAGIDAAKEDTDLNLGSFRSLRDGVLLRQSDGFVNHLYFSPSGEKSRAVVTHNSKTGSITVSLYDPIEGFSCRDFVQGLWGPEAGGHAGIAGSPREKVYDFEEAVATAHLLTEALRAV